MSCTRCGMARAADAAFCAGCGSRFDPDTRATGGDARARFETLPETQGRSCTYCHTPLVARAPVASCLRCAATHHADCWGENGGCATPACTNGPATEAPTSTEVVQAGLTAPAAAAPEPPVANSSRRALATLAAALGSVTLVAVGVATALVLRPTADPASAALAPAPTAVPPATIATSIDAKDAGDEKTEDARRERAGDPDFATDAQVGRAVTRMLRVHHQAIQRGDWRRAFATLSRRKQDQKRSEARSMGLADGIARYRAQFAGELEGNLRIGSLDVQVESVDPDRGIAEIRMTFAKRDGAFYCGVTWALFEGGRWRYDLGSSGYTDRPMSGPEVLQTRSGSC